jgi:anaerobic selenocysteine-containing dehydrogenase
VVEGLSLPQGHDALYALPDGHAEEWEILTRLGWLFSGGTSADYDQAALDDGWFRALCGMYGVDADTVMAQYDDGGPERIIDLTIRMGPWGDHYGEHPDGLVLVSRRHLRSKNSWMHNVKVLVKGKDRCTLLIHPDDAAVCGVVDGGRARVSSEAGSIEVPVEMSDEMMPGVVSLPHGWGHDKPGTQLSVAREHAGVNNNLLAPGTFVDELSGNAAVNGVPVEVVPA